MPLPTTVYQTPGWLYDVTQVGGAGLSTVALTVVPAVVLGIAKAVAFAHKSFAGGVGGGGVKQLWHNIVIVRQACAVAQPALELQCW